MSPSEDDTAPDLCRSFRRNPDGSWTCVEASSIVAVAGKVVTIKAGETVRAGDLIAGYDLGAYLEQFCDPEGVPN